jgi:hypothetical protein
MKNGYITSQVIADTVFLSIDYFESDNVADALEDLSDGVFPFRILRDNKVIKVPIDRQWINRAGLGLFGSVELLGEINLI